MVRPSPRPPLGMAEDEHPPPTSEAALGELVGQLEARSDFGLHNVDYSSGVRGGEAVHRSIGRIFGRQSA